MTDQWMTENDFPNLRAYMRRRSEQVPDEPEYRDTVEYQLRTQNLIQYARTYGTTAANSVRGLIERRLGL